MGDGKGTAGHHHAGTTDRVQLVKLYPEGNAQTRLQLRGMGRLYIYCNKHSLMRWK